MKSIVRRLFCFSLALAMRAKRIHNLIMVRAKVRRPKRSALAQAFYDARYRSGEYALRGFMVVLPWVPYRWLEIFTSGMSRLAFMFLWRYRKRMEASVTKALGEQITDPAEREALVKRAWNNFARGVLDTMAVMHMSKERTREFIALEGEEHLKRALAKGKGVIALSAHLGAFTLIGARLAASGYSFSVVVKHPPDDRFARVMNDLRAQLGISTISARPRQEAVRGILKALRRNGIVLVIADEFKSGDVNTSFMGQEAAAPRGPASLSLRTGAVTLPMFAPRLLDGSVTLRIGPEVEPVRDDDVEASVAKTTTLFTRCIETAIRQFPDQWNWLGFPRPDRISRAEYFRRWRAAKRARAAKARAALDLAQNSQSPGASAAKDSAPNNSGSVRE
jgi:KDO2-lipid IV(A) lauroyltransferase